MSYDDKCIIIAVYWGCCRFSDHRQNKCQSIRHSRLNWTRKDVGHAGACLTSWPILREGDKDNLCVHLHLLFWLSCSLSSSLRSVMWFYQNTFLCFLLLLLSKTPLILFERNSLFFQILWIKIILQNPTAAGSWHLLTFVLLSVSPFPVLAGSYEQVLWFSQASRRWVSFLSKTSTLQLHVPQSTMK